ncbi:hypothetical protein CBL_13906 [Carabus blaptoides fortunei]
MYPCSDRLQIQQTRIVDIRPSQAAMISSQMLPSHTAEEDGDCGAVKAFRVTSRCAGRLSRPHYQRHDCYVGREYRATSTTKTVDVSSTSAQSQVRAMCTYNCTAHCNTLSAPELAPTYLLAIGTCTHNHENGKFSFMVCFGADYQPMIRLGNGISCPRGLHALGEAVLLCHMPVKPVLSTATCAYCGLHYTSPTDSGLHTITSLLVLQLLLLFSSPNYYIASLPAEQRKHI